MINDHKICTEEINMNYRSTQQYDKDVRDHNARRQCVHLA